jgi:hypothetical protein
VFSRALGATEIRDVAQAHPALAHRYSFQTDATDTIGVAHGTLMGNAIVTNNALKLTGVSNDYARLPGGLVSGCAAVTLEFWATFGTNGNWARVFDFGTTTTPGTSGQQFLFFTPHTSSGSHRLGISAGGTVFDLDSPGTLDGRTVHVACIVDPANSYCAMYTNGVLDRAQTTALPALSTISPVLSYVGRSLFTNDAWLNATIAEFRIYDGRLTPEEIAANTAAGPDALALPIQLAVSNSASDLALTWPSYATGFNLESSPVLGPGAIWTPLTQSATLGNDRWKVTVPMTNNVRFYRLRK